ncbi:M56 family metallopeptidase [Lysobacter antibioticus]|uniref:M56 family metallopeptidase n=1 Tax=Lysobacter antibioticus TaxID=84531 RepID=UPI00034AE46E|nr:M56 family metallopeptidase [Lysobacter antibioticus]
MGRHDWSAALIETTLAMSAALALVLLLRAPLRRGFGAGVAYAAWLIVPASMLAVLLPSWPPRDAGVLSMAMQPVALYAERMQAAAVVQESWRGLGTVWALGAAVMALLLLWRQWRFVRGLGALRRRADGLHEARTDCGLPAAFGLWRPRIVVPRDFERRYSAVERSLVRAHERSHIVRGDLHLNAFVALLSCLYWFNPLLHYAVGRFRADQEFACDARVLRRYPGARRYYAEAMLKSALRVGAAPLTCSWASTHPITERIAMLRHPLPGAVRARIGAVALAALGGATAFAAWATQPTLAPQERLITMSIERPVSQRGFALRVATEAGLRLENPEALDDTRRMLTFDLQRVSAKTAFQLIEAEFGLAAQFRGEAVRLVPGVKRRAPPAANARR